MPLTRLVSFIFALSLHVFVVQSESCAGHNSTLVYDGCGVCGGDNSTCVGCDNVVASGLVVDRCGVCAGNNSCVGGCDSQPNSIKVYDVCGVCGGNNTTCISGCDSQPFSELRYDHCGVCGGDNSSCAGCDGIPNSGLVYDACGVCGGLASCLQSNRSSLFCDGNQSHYDICGVCGGSNSTCMGCDGVPNSGLIYDTCGVCNGDNSTCVCPVYDRCGVCNGTNHCIGCDGVAWSNTTYDLCGVCAGNNGTCSSGCDNTPFSNKTFDSCGICAGSNSTCAGCDGVPWSNLTLDLCDVCGGRNACLGCNGVPNSGAVYDICGVCGGRNDTCVFKDCMGLVFGSHVNDSCGVCGGDGSSCRAPAVQYLRYSSSFGSISVRFDVNIDLSSHVLSSDCRSQLHSSHHASLGFGASCFWRDARTWVLRPGFNSSLPLDLWLSFSPTWQLRQHPTAFVLNTTTLYGPVQKPSLPTLQPVFFAKPQVVNECTDLILDASLSYGNGGRMWTSVAWTFTAQLSSEYLQSSSLQESAVLQSLAVSFSSITSASASATLDLSSFGVTTSVTTATSVETSSPAPTAASNSTANTTTPSSSTSTTTSSTQLPPGTYTFTCSLATWLGTTANASVVVQRVNETRPAVFIAASPRVQLATNTEVRLRGGVSDSAACMPAAILAFRWTISPEVPGLAVPLTLETLTLPPSLLVPQVYIVNLNVTLANSTWESSSTARVHLDMRAPLPLVVLMGGDRLVSHTQAVVLDASASHDPSAPHGASNLVFSWRCVREPTNAMETVLGDTACDNSTLAYLTPSAVITLPPNSLLSRWSYRFTCTVSSLDLSRSSSLASVLHVVPGGAPHVLLTPPTRPRVNSDAVLVTSGTSFNLTLQWTVRSRLENLSTFFTLNDTLLSPQNLLTSTTTDSLVLAPNVLQVGREYSFRLTGVSKQQFQGWAQVVVSVNEPPLLHFNPTLSPVLGTAASTVFTLDVGLWSDADLPLSYSLFTTVSDSVPLRLVRSSPFPRFPLRLTAGDAAANYALKCVLHTVDSLGATTPFLLAVEVWPLAFGSTVLLDGLEQEVTRLVARHAVDDATELLSAIVAGSASQSTSYRAQMSARLLPQLAALVGMRVPIMASVSLEAESVSGLTLPEGLGVDILALAANLASRLCADLTAIVAGSTDMVPLARELGSLSRVAANVLKPSLTATSTTSASPPTTATSSRRLAGSANRVLSATPEETTALWLAHQSLLRRVVSLGVRQHRAGQKAFVVAAEAFTATAARVSHTASAIRVVSGVSSVEFGSLQFNASVAADVHVVEYTRVPFPVLHSTLEATGAVLAVELPTFVGSSYAAVVRVPLPVAGSNTPGKTRVCVLWDSASLQWQSSVCSHVLDSGKATCTCPSLPSLAYVSTALVPAGCDGLPFSTTVLDICGLCGGNNSTCMGCDGVPLPLGGLQLDACGLCGGDGSSCAGCDGLPQSNAQFDACGVCKGDSTSCAGCDMVPNSGVTFDDCGVCGGSGQDKDSCGICNGANALCNSRGTCQSQNVPPPVGLCLCDGNFAGPACDLCAPNWFGAHCDIPCSPDATCNGHGVCSFLGLCECSGGFSGSDCSICPVDYYGPDCSTFCSAVETCLERGVCDNFGACECFSDFTGSDCGQCLRADYYGAHCTIYCVSETSCSAHGSCASSGACECVSRYGGAACDVCAPEYFGNDCQVYCVADDTCSGHGVCSGAGQCDCSGAFTGVTCSACQRNYYGSDCNTFCDMATTCKGHGVCSSSRLPLTVCECTGTYSGRSCTSCIENFFGDQCTTFCQADTTCSGHGQCDPSLGSCNCYGKYSGIQCHDCQINFYGPDCDTFCADEQTCTPPFVCQVGTGACGCPQNFAGDDCRSCKPHWYTTECTVFCDPASTCSGHGSCTPLKGLPCSCFGNHIGDSCEFCVRDMFGVECNIFCSVSSCPEPRHCDRSTGDCICDGPFGGELCDRCGDVWFGHGCSVFCEPTETCRGHGVCSEDTGACVCAPLFVGGDCSGCIADLYGENCTVHCNQQQTCSGHGTCSAHGCVCLSNWDGTNCSHCAPTFFGEGCDIVCVHSECGAFRTCSQQGKCECVPQRTGDNCLSCAHRYYGIDCEIFCEANTTCMGRGVCSRSGFCVCDELYKGASCEQCSAENYYADNCTVFCEPSANCSAHGSCAPVDGSCVCETRWAGVNCSDCSLGFYGPECTLNCSCSGNGGCDRRTGACECFVNWLPATNCSTCAEFYYGDACDLYCQPGVTCGDRGECDTLIGTCICNPQFRGATCEACALGYFGQDCENFCDPVMFCNGHGTCPEGKCICDEGYGGLDCLACDEGSFGDNCETKCVAFFTCTNHGECLADGSCACEADYYGTNCSVRCTEELCFQHGFCHELTGDCVCFENRDPAVRCAECNQHWFGEVCDQFCDPAVTCSGANHGVCTKEATCHCFPQFVGVDCSRCAYENFYGKDCEVYCLADVTCSGHGSCVPTNGRCHCQAGYFDDDCSTYELPELTTFTALDNNGGLVSAGLTRLSVPSGALTTPVNATLQLYNNRIVKLSNTTLVPISPLYELSPRGLVFKVPCAFFVSLLSTNDQISATTPAPTTPAPVEPTTPPPTLPEVTPSPQANESTSVAPNASVVANISSNSTNTTSNSSTSPTNSSKPRQPENPPPTATARRGDSTRHLLQDGSVSNSSSNSTAAHVVNSTNVTNATIASLGNASEVWNANSTNTTGKAPHNVSRPPPTFPPTPAPTIALNDGVTRVAALFVFDVDRYAWVEVKDSVLLSSHEISATITKFARFMVMSKLVQIAPATNAPTSSPTPAPTQPIDRHLGVDSFSMLVALLTAGTPAPTPAPDPYLAGKVVGGVFGTLGGIGLCVLLFCCIKHRKQRLPKPKALRSNKVVDSSLKQELTLLAADLDIERGQAASEESSPQKVVFKEATRLGDQDGPLTRFPALSPPRPLTPMVKRPLPDGVEASPMPTYKVLPPLSEDPGPFSPGGELDDDHVPRESPKLSTPPRSRPKPSANDTNVSQDEESPAPSPPLPYEQRTASSPIGDGARASPALPPVTPPPPPPEPTSEPNYGVSRCSSPRSPRSSPPPTAPVAPPAGHHSPRLSPQIRGSPPMTREDLRSPARPPSPPSNVFTPRHADESSVPAVEELDDIPAGPPRPEMGGDVGAGEEGPVRGDPAPKENPFSLKPLRPLNAPTEAPSKGASEQAAEGGNKKKKKKKKKANDSDEEGGGGGLPSLQPLKGKGGLPALKPIGQ